MVKGSDLSLQADIYQPRSPGLFIVEDQDFFFFLHSDYILWRALRDIIMAWVNIGGSPRWESRERHEA